MMKKKNPGIKTQGESKSGVDDALALDVEALQQLVESKLKTLKAVVTRIALNKKQTNAYVTVRISSEVFRNI